MRLFLKNDLEAQAFENKKKLRMYIHQILLNHKCKIIQQSLFISMF